MLVSFCPVSPEKEELLGIEAIQTRHGQPRGETPSTFTWGCEAGLTQQERAVWPQQVKRQRASPMPEAATPKDRCPACCRSQPRTRLLHPLHRATLSRAEGGGAWQTQAAVRAALFPHWGFLHACYCDN